MRGLNAASHSINGYLPSEIHEENELDEAGTTHKKPSLYNYSRYNETIGNRASYINNIEIESDLKSFDIKPKHINQVSLNQGEGGTATNQSSLSDIIASSS